MSDVQNLLWAIQQMGGGQRVRQSHWAAGKCVHQVGDHFEDDTGQVWVPAIPLSFDECWELA